MSSTRYTDASITQVLTLWRSGREEEARAACESLAAEDENPDALSLLAEIHASARRHEQAASSLRGLIRLRPADAGAYRRLGDACLASGAFAEAESRYREALVIEPASARAHNNLGLALIGLRQFAEAASSYRRALELDPRYAIAHNNLGIALFEQGAAEQSVACYQRALELRPSFTEAHCNCGNALLKLNRTEAALQCYERALTLSSTSVEALLGRGNALQRLRRYTDAVRDYERALRLDPRHVEALTNCASALLVLRKPEEALRLAERAVAIKSDLAEAHSNLAGALRRLHRYEEALTACDLALQLKPDSAGALSNRANVLLALNRRGEALECCERALAQQPDLAEAYDNLGGVLMVERRTEDAARAYERLLEIDPDYDLVLGALLHARGLCCDWRDEAPRREQLVRGVEQCRPVSHPFAFVTLSDSPALQLQCARAYAARELPSIPKPLWQGERYRHERIRVAYLSADFHDHATAMLMAGLFEAHDRERFETLAVSYGPNDGSAMRQRLERAFDRFIDVRDAPSSEIAQWLRSQEVDIAVDLKGYTRDSRVALLASRPAPVQVSYLGYPGTLALEQIDYILADPIVLPPEHQGHYSERIVYLPDCYQVNDSKRVISEPTPTRAEVGLPASGFVFCCFNHNYKITPEVFTVWMGLLQRVPDSVLWLLGDNAGAVGNLKQAAAERGMDPERLVFAPRIASADHLARHRLADLFLDTLPYNAHTTASDALWAGLPVLTCLGTAFPGRVAASLLHAVGLPELVTHSPREYTARALELATDPHQLGELRARLARNRSTHPLFDTERFRRHLEAAYATMWQRYQVGLPPESFDVPRLA